MSGGLTAADPRGSAAASGTLLCGFVCTSRLHSAAATARRWAHSTAQQPESRGVGGGSLLTLCLLLLMLIVGCSWLRR